LAALYIGAGPGVNAFFLLRGDDYANLARGSYIPYVRDTLASLVVPNHDFFISALVAFELAVGVLALLGGRRTQIAYVAAIAFHVALLSFGWGFYVWHQRPLAVTRGFATRRCRLLATPSTAK